MGHVVIEGTIHIRYPSLDDGGSTLGTGLKWPDKQGIASQWLLGRKDGIEFGVDGTKQLGIAVRDSILAILHPTGEPIEPHRTDGAVWADDDGADLGSSVLAPACNFFGQIDKSSLPFAANY